MTTKTSLAVLGPALIVAVIVQAFNLTAILPPFLLAFLVALFASIAVLFQLSYSGKSARVGHKYSSASAEAATGKRQSGKELGNVKWFNSNKGFGFITRDNGEEIFVHFRSIVNGKSLRDGQRVEFAVTAGTKGLQAENVVALK